MSQNNRKSPPRSKSLRKSSAASYIALDKKIEDLQARIAVQQQKDAIKEQLAQLNALKPPKKVYASAKASSSSNVVSALRALSRGQSRGPSRGSSPTNSVSSAASKSRAAPRSLQQQLNNAIALRKKRIENNAAINEARSARATTPAKKRASAAASSASESKQEKEDNRQKQIAKLQAQLAKLQAAEAKKEEDEANISPAERRARMQAVATTAKQTRKNRRLAQMHAYYRKLEGPPGKPASY